VRGCPELKLLTDEIDRESYRRDETSHWEPGLPLAVALPTTTAEVAGIMRAATEHRVPVVPRGAGSGLSGGAPGWRAP
jgi:glycolate oxidase